MSPSTQAAALGVFVGLEVADPAGGTLHAGGSCPRRPAPGGFSPEAAEATGIPAGLPLIAAAADKACEVIGAGCLEPDVACLSYGTTATINTTHRKYLEAIPLIPPYPSAVPGAYSQEIMVYRGYWMVSWFKREFADRELALASEQGVEPEVLFDELLRQSPPGSHGLVLQPYWSPGVKVPGTGSAGRHHRFRRCSQPAHVYRAILEGVAYALREGKERTEKRSGIPITTLRVAGGGSQSDGAMQLTADIFGPAHGPGRTSTRHRASRRQLTPPSAQGSIRISRQRSGK